MIFFRLKHIGTYGYRLPKMLLSLHYNFCHTNSFTKQLRFDMTFVIIFSHLRQLKYKIKSETCLNSGFAPVLRYVKMLYGISLIKFFLFFYSAPLVDNISCPILSHTDRSMPCIPGFLCIPLYSTCHVCSLHSYFSMYPKCYLL